MYSRTTGSYDEIPEGMMIYINNYGCHFNKKLCAEAISRMYYVANGKKEYINPYTKEEVEEMLKAYNIKLKNNKLYDAVYVANMCKADYYGSSITDEKHFALYIKDTIDDEDAGDGTTMRRWYATMVANGTMVDWEEFI